MLVSGGGILELFTGHDETAIGNDFARQTSLDNQNDPFFVIPSGNVSDSPTGYWLGGEYHSIARPNNGTFDQMKAYVADN